MTTSPRWRRLREPLLLAAGVAAALGVLHVRDPNVPGHYPLCPILWATGLTCPGCGSLRSLHDLTHGDVVGAFARNPLVPLLLVVGVVGLLRFGARRWRGDPAAPGPLVRLLTWRGGLLVVGVWVGLFVARNIPGWSWLSPA